MKLRSILATDCGSTTTKAILIEFIDGEYRLTHRGEAPTTVEAPFEDVTRGVLNATMEVEELSGRKILDGDILDIDSTSGRIEVNETVAKRDIKAPSKNNQINTFGRNLFSLLRQNASSAENGAGLDIINNY